MADVDTKKNGFQNGNGMHYTNGEVKQNGAHHQNGFHDHGKSDDVSIIEVHDTNGEIKPSDSKDTEGDKKDDKGPMVGVFEVFRYRDGLDILLMIIGSVASAAQGIALPCMLLVFGDMIDTFTFVDDICKNCTSNASLGLINWFNTQNKKSLDCDKLISTKDEDKQLVQDYLHWMERTFNRTIESPKFNVDALMDNMLVYALYYIGIGCGVLVCAYLGLTCWSVAAKRQGRRIRLLFFKAMLRQDIGWFDTHPSGELSTRLSDDVDKIEAGIGDKMASMVQLSCGAIGAVVLAFVNGWKLTLVIVACSPLILAAATVMGKVNKDSATKELKAYAQAGSVAEEVLSSVRTVVAFGGQKKECERYNKRLEAAKMFGIRTGTITGVAMGLVMCIVYLAYALGFWYGTKLVLDTKVDGQEEFSVGKMLVVFFAVLIGAFQSGQALPALQDLAVARGAAYFVYNLIERVPVISADSEQGEKPSSVTGTVAFKDVHFSYPSRPDIKILDGLNLEIGTSQTVALVGSSGCGKSTCVQLIQRFYDVASGLITLDGRDLRSLNVRWLRSQIGIVSQEPILFATTIAENIRYGRDGVTQEDIIAAAQAANAHDFISRLPQKYETLVGARGAQLSGGQKQRIAIARALVNTPKILLLDEATSALDTESEATVQAALDKAREGRTTIVVAHRLSTVQNANLIVALQNGRVAEKGTHDQLMALDGVYARLVKSQLRKAHHTDDDDESDTEDELEKEEEFKRTLSMRSNGDLRKRAGSIHSNGSARKLAHLSSQISVGAEKEELPKEEEVKPLGMCSILSWNRQEWFFILIGVLGALIEGGTQPAMAIVFSKILAGFMACSPEKVQNSSNFFAIMFLVIGVVMLVSVFLKSLMFSISGERLTERIRSSAFYAMLRQDIAYFDDPKNATGALTTRLATEASAIQGATGRSLGSLFNALSNLGVGIIIAFIFSWKLTLAILAFVPFIGVAGFIQMKVRGPAGGATNNKALYEESGKIATECVENIRTVQSLGKEKLFYLKYEEKTLTPHRSELRSAQAVGITFSVSQAIVFFAYAALFYLGAYLIKINDLDFESMMITFGCVVFGAMSLGQATSFAPSYKKGTEAAAHIKLLLEREPAIDSYSADGDVPDSHNGTIAFKDTVFHYPTRKTVRVLTGLNVSVGTGETLALVGSSGCGKSTTIQLLERFYDPDSGHVMIDHRDVRSVNIAWLRSQIGIVSQEPVLFDRSIAENIAYGANDRKVTMDEIIQAAKKANIHSFIETLPLGYETRVGDKGTQLSGGQKQRVAIARALVRNPKILLLDEATSALDSESERVVQEALDNAREGRTCIVIAHRLSTIQNANKIAVIRHGHVTEMGSHKELMDLKGFYCKLQNVQKKA